METVFKLLLAATVVAIDRMERELWENHNVSEHRTIEHGIIAGEDKQTEWTMSLLLSFTILIVVVGWSGILNC